MSAIKQYFKQAKEAVVRKQNFVVKRELQRLKKIREAEEVNRLAFEKEFNETETVLRMGYFLSDEDLIEYVEEMYDDVFEKVMENVNSYPDHIRDVLIRKYDPPKFPTGNLKLVDLTDDDMERMEELNKKKLDESFETEWQKYKKEKGMDRPEGELEDKYTDLYESLQLSKKELEDELKKPSSKKYVPPSMRSTVPTISPEVANINKKIQDIENEISKVKKEIEQEEKIWEDDKRAEASSEILRKVFGV